MAIAAGMGRILALLALLATLPLLLLLALLIKAGSRGPVLYCPWRLGLAGRPFRLYKLRTMCPEAAAHLPELVQGTGAARAHWEKHGKLPDDPRVTRFGRFLRQSSLDELPQLWNIVRGEMHWVGPRPIMDYERQRYGEAFAVLAGIKPGLTGWWQVSGRSRTTYAERVRLDLWYISHRSLRLDVWIIVKTVAEVFRGRGAC